MTGRRGIRAVVINAEGACEVSYDDGSVLTYPVNIGDEPMAAISREQLDALVKMKRLPVFDILAQMPSDGSIDIPTAYREFLDRMFAAGGTA